MPFIDGETLRSKLDRETQLGIEESLRIATDVAGALDYAHRHGVIHRDIKPRDADPMPSLWRLAEASGALERVGDLPAACLPVTVTVGAGGRAAACMVEDGRADIWLYDVPGVMPSLSLAAPCPSKDPSCPIRSSPTKIHSSRASATPASGRSAPGARGRRCGSWGRCSGRWRGDCDAQREERFAVESWRATPMASSRRKAMQDMPIAGTP